MNIAPHIAVTRNKKLAGEEALEAQGWRFTHHDFIRKVIEIPERISNDIHQNIVITSQTGVQAFVEILKRFELSKSNYVVFCIDHATKEQALQAGLIVHASAPNARSLAHEILKHPFVKSVTHVASNVRRGELAQTLQQSGVAVDEILAYRTELTPIVLNIKIDGIIFYSPSAVKSFLLKNPLPISPCFCIGSTTAHYAKQLNCNWVYSANTPTDESIMTLITEHFSKPTIHA
jgi:uroporphyrinogen-III synthase